MYQLIKTDCFVLKRNDFRDYDRFYTVYTREMGKVSILARSSKKPKSKLAPRLETFGQVRINFIKGKIFNYLSGINLGPHNKNILLDYDKIVLAGEVISFFDKLIKMEEADEKLYDLLYNTLTSIDENDIWQFYKIRVYFFWRLIDILGYKPALDKCALCENIVIRKAIFNITDNIIICSNCRGKGIEMDAETLNSLKKIFIINFKDILQISVSEKLSILTARAKELKLSEL